MCTIDRQLRVVSAIERLLPATSTVRRVLAVQRSSTKVRFF